jgi:alkanesulfonate monooxygenase SsuD/methylene tetrahydromethanopterin reductase-like flavin-dependent oxidoreductase (luciferase family)
LAVVRIGLALPHYDFSFPDGEPVSWERLLDATTRAEALGFDSGWISDHFFLDLVRYGGPGDPAGSLEPFTTIAALTAVTERIRLGTLVACAPFRHPAHVAKMSTAIDLAGGGRFDLGLGAGWYEREFRAFGYDYPPAPERFALLEESVAAVAELFAADEPVDFDGRFVQLAGAFNHPRPATLGGPPLWIGGKGGARLLRLVARHAAGWNTVWKWTPEAHAARVRVLREIAEDGGRDPATVRLSVGLFTVVGEDDRDLAARYRALQGWAPGGAMDDVPLEDFAADTLVGTVEQCLERLAAFAQGGVEEMILCPASVPFSVFDWGQVELIAERLIPSARDL